MNPIESAGEGLIFCVFRKPKLKYFNLRSIIDVINAMGVYIPHSKGAALLSGYHLIQQINDRALEYLDSTK